MNGVYIGASSLITALGRGVKVNADAVENCLSGVTLHESADFSSGPLYAASIPESVYREAVSEYGELPRAELLLSAVVGDVLKESGTDLSDPETMLVISTTKGDVELLDPSDSMPDGRTYLWKTGENVARRFGAGDRFIVISNACISGVSAMIVAMRLVSSGRCRRAVVAGCDVLSHFVVSGFASFKSLSSGRCRPYDASRDGLNLGEAAGAVVLGCGPEDGQVVISGGSISDDANHISGPSRTGDGLFFAMRDAMREAGVTPDEISFMELHGTATVYNDEMESKAIALAGMSPVPVQSLKPYFGHTLGASGVIETIMSIEQMKRGVVWGTPGFVTMGVPEPVNVSAEHRKCRMRHCLKAASGFGGCNAAIVLSLPEYVTDREDRWSLSRNSATEAEVLRTVEISDGRILRNGHEVFSSKEQDFGDFAREAYRASGRTYMKFFKMDNLCKLGYLAAEELLDGIGFEPLETALVLSNSSSSLDSDLRHLEEVALHGEQGASPAVFVYTLPNVVSGEICIRHRIKGENTFFITREYAPGKLRGYASMIMSGCGYRYCIAGWCEMLKGRYMARFELLGPGTISGNEV